MHGLVEMSKPRIRTTTNTTSQRVARAVPLPSRRKDAQACAADVGFQHSACLTENLNFLEYLAPLTLRRSLRTHLLAHSPRNQGQHPIPRLKCVQVPHLGRRKEGALMPPCCFCPASRVVPPSSSGKCAWLSSLGVSCQLA